MRPRQLILLGLVALAVAAAGPALARSSLGIGSAEVTAQPSGGLLGGLFTQIAVYQREFFTALRGALIDLKDDGLALPFLVGLSFAYGVFHAAGPGHGKAVISAYVLANEVELRRGIMLSFVSSLVQALSALVIVGAGWFVLRGTSVSMTDATDLLEMASYALVAGFGAWLLARKLAALAGGFRRGGGSLAFAPAGQYRDSGAMGALAFAAPERAEAQSGARLMRPASGGLAAGVCTDAEEDCGCGRSHMPDPKTLGEKVTFGSAASAIMAVGLRPCSGAIVVLTFALVNGLYLGGVLSVLAMALGTAITVSAIAAIAVFAKGFALQLGGTRYRMVTTAVEIGGALLLLVLGLLLLGGALQTI
ncbi:nickel/cobalt transporter [Aurantimonas sp. HBX-1]|uniref:nickel/cobalt transporter n=1 Tax=Aurantimonas sp. HBX-1 TaxID=2906072 RepID=UPI001F353142|nr:nickel/cobalt transporter [Aurantimonas sp. HBX-1]UIJ72762.1 nickel/cobalt transporter [Aurantimonas sp. HBX-1]